MRKWKNEKDMTLKEILARLRKTRILVVGDIVLDEFLWGTVRRISPEAPVPVVEVTKESQLLGGAANVVNNIISLGTHALLCGVIGDDRAGERILELLRESKEGGQGPLAAKPVQGDGVIVTQERPTSVKTRIIAQHQQVVRFDRETRDVIPTGVKVKMLTFLRDAIPGVDAVIISDYGKGVVSRHLVEAVLKEARKRNTVVCIDPKPENFLFYRGATIVTPNLQEAQAAVRFPLVTTKDIEKGAGEILKILGCKAVLITRGEHGMCIAERGRKVVHIPTVAREVFDVTGAGDTVIATLTACIGAGASLRKAAIIANHAAGIVVGKLGTATASREEIMESLRQSSRIEMG